MTKAAPSRQAGSKSRFVVVGGSAFVLGGCMVEGLTALGMSPYIAQFPTFLAGATYTWLLNRRLTFAVSERRTLREYLRYLASSAGGLAISMAGFSLLTWVGAPALGALAAGSAVGLVFNYLSYSRFVFADSRPAGLPSALQACDEVQLASEQPRERPRV